MRSIRVPILSLLAGVGFLLSARQVLAVPCDTFDECMTNGMCQANGECTGTPAPDGTGCNDSNDCTKMDRCQAGVCKGDPDMSKDGEPCENVFGKCAAGATCNVQVIEIPGQPPFGFALCVPEDVVDCPETDSDKCTLDFCNPETGACSKFTNNCLGQCGSCNSGTGDCTANPKPNGSACDDFNPCTANDGCQGGSCVAGGNSGPTVTRTPTIAGLTPTRTATSVAATATRTSTAAPATATRTSTVPPPTATRTPTAVPATATRTRTSTPPASACFADCDGNGTVNAADLNRINQTLLKCGPCAGGSPGGVAAGCAATSAVGCIAADFDKDGCIRASELARANRSVFQFPPDGCP